MMLFLWIYTTSVCGYDPDFDVGAAFILGLTFSGCVKIHGVKPATIKHYWIIYIES